MNTTPEMTDAEKDLVEKLEAAGFPETARFIRNLIASTQNRDANADAQNITPSQARYAYDSALKPEATAPFCRDCQHFQPAMSFMGYLTPSHCTREKTESLVTGSVFTTMLNCDLERTKIHDGQCGPSGRFFQPKIPKHTFIHLSGATRTENACL